MARPSSCLAVVAICAALCHQSRACLNAVSQSPSSAAAPSPAAAPPQSTADVHQDAIRIINDKLGPDGAGFGKDGVRVLRGGGLAASSSSDLSCGFEERCCWHNVANGADDLEWLVVHDNPVSSKAYQAFGVDNTPTAPFAITAAYQSTQYTYAFLTSCPITCQNGDGVLTFDHWLTESVALDVCTLPLNSRDFNFCDTITNRQTVSSRVVIPAQSEPFNIVIVASEFVTAQGMAAVDNIVYEADICGDGGGGGGDGGGIGDATAAGPATTTTTPPEDVFVDTEFKLQAALAAVPCDFTDGTVCEWIPLHTNDLNADRAMFFTATDEPRHYGNWAAGVRGPPPGHRWYAAADVPPGMVAAMKTRSFQLRKDFNMSFLFYEAADNVDMRICYDSQSNPLTCKTVSRQGVIRGDNQWKTATFFVPSGKDTIETNQQDFQTQVPRRLFIVSENTGYQQASVGVADIKLVFEDAAHQAFADKGVTAATLSPEEAAARIDAAAKPSP